VSGHGAGRDQHEAHGSSQDSPPRGHGDLQQEKIFRITNIWIKQQEKWKIATSQATELKQPPLLKKI
jgi:hypothetical protein